MTDDRNMKKEISSFEDLVVFQKAYKLSLKLHKLTLSMPKEEQYGLASQIRQASKSICANIAEGFAQKLELIFIFLSSVFCHLSSDG